jgi:RNA polymerase sigma factor (sigma-70 family)
VPGCSAERTAQQHIWQEAFRQLLLVRYKGVMADSPYRALDSTVLPEGDPAGGDLEEPPSKPATGREPSHVTRIDHLFREHNEALLRFLSARLGSYQDAQEVAQEAYVRLLRLDRPGAVSFLKALLYKTASNLAIDRLRHRHLVTRYECAAAKADDLFEASADATSAAIDDVRVISSAIDELPPHCRSAFLMSRVEALDSLEIAQRLGVTDRAVRKYIARALVFLQLRLQQAHTPGGRETSVREGELR